MSDTATTLDIIPTAELSTLSLSIYRSTVRLYNRASAIHAEMSTMATWTPAYAEMKREAAAIMAAAHEQTELHTEIVDLACARHAG